VETPETRYAVTSDGVHIAYQVVGRGPINFVYVNSAFNSNVEIVWEWEPARLFRWLAARGRVLVFDRRGSGLSDAVSGENLPTIEARMEDITAVMDEAGFERAVLLALEDGAAQAFMFAATHPERTSGLISFCGAVHGTYSPEAPWAWTDDEWNEALSLAGRNWGTAESVQALLEEAFPSRARDKGFKARYGRALRHSLTPAAASSALRMYRDTDASHILPLIQAPTLVVHPVDDRSESIEEGRYIASEIPAATLLEVPGSDLAPWDMVTQFSDDVEAFLGRLQEVEQLSDRVLATVLFTDIVGSTEMAVELGDGAWKQVLSRHRSGVRALLGRYRGREIDTAGDGFLSIFDGPARAIRCAAEIRDLTNRMGVQVRAGVHTGEVETVGDGISGIAVHIGARVAALAAASEVMVSQTVKDLVAGSGLTFIDAGEHVLKGVPDRWRLYRLAI
jgi:class 3 adenylate cyclase